MAFKLIVSGVTAGASAGVGVPAIVDTSVGVRRRVEVGGGVETGVGSIVDGGTGVAAEMSGSVDVGVGVDANVGIADIVASTPAVMVAWVSGVLVASWSWHARANTRAKSVKTAIVGLVMDKLLKDISGRLFG